MLIAFKGCKFQVLPIHPPLGNFQDNSVDCIKGKYVKHIKKAELHVVQEY
jgi:hypothetical protein